MKRYLTATAHVDIRRNVQLKRRRSDGEVQSCNLNIFLVFCIYESSNATTNVNPMSDYTTLKQFKLYLNLK